jgi:hypothetical protein
MKKTNINGRGISGWKKKLTRKTISCPTIRFLKKKPYRRNHLSLGAMSHWLETKNELHLVNIN